jgi:hypothetical protein
MAEPTRHRASSRNRRKALHLAKNLLDELLCDLKKHARAGTRLNYKIDRALKLKNRLRAERR